MVRVPRSWVRAGFAGLPGAQRQTGIAARRIPVPADELYRDRVTVDLGNDGIAPTVQFQIGGYIDIYEDIYLPDTINAAAFVGPSSGGDLWSLDQCYLSTSTGQLDTSQVIVYVGPLPLAQYAVTGSLAGGSSQFGMGGIGVPFGWFVWGIWTGGVTGASAYLRLTGVKSVLTNSSVNI